MTRAAIVRWLWSKKQETTKTRVKIMAETIHSSDETAHQRPSYDDINTPVVIMWGFISAVLTLVTILTMSGVYNVWSASAIKNREGQYVNQPAREQVVQQMNILKGDDGSVPIADAMKKVVDQYGKSH